jgi:general secretion pathway protein D
MNKRCVLAVIGAALLGSVVQAQLAAPTNAVVTARGVPTINFNFDQVEIRTLARIVGEMTGRRFLVDNTVTSRVTVVTPAPVPQATVYPLFLNVLEATGYSVVEHEQMFHIVPLPERGLPAAPLATDTNTAQGVVTKIIALQNISAAEIRKVLEPMVRGGKAGALAAVEQTNHLLITDTRSNIARLEKVIAELDKPGASRGIEILKLEHAAADEVAQQINAALRGSETAGSRISRQVQQIAGGGTGLPTDIIVVASAQANTLLLAGRQSQLAEIKALIKQMDVEPTPATAGRLNAVFLKYLPAADAAKSLTALLVKTVDKDQRQRIAVEANAANNALMIEASPADFELVRGLITKLDQMPQQVMVEILIAEVSMGKSLNLGVNWNRLEIPSAGETTPLGRFRGSATDVLAGALTNTFPQGLAVGIAHGNYTDAAGNVLPNVVSFVTALAGNNDVKILSNVPLWAQNNVEASVNVVDNIPIRKSTIEGGAGTARDVIQNIERMDVGIKLKFTPQVNPDNQVMMKLNPSIEAISDPGPADQFAPTIAKRDVTTTVTVPDNATIIISGLIRQDRLQSVNKIPLLGDIPLLGFLFRSTSEKTQRTNLLIFVTPHIVSDMRRAMELQSALEGKTGIGASTNLILSPAPTNAAPPPPAPAAKKATLFH